MKKHFTKLTILFLALVLSPSLTAQMTLEFNTNLSSGTTVTLPLYGTVNVTVDWGDGNSEPFTTSGDKDHTYTSEGSYTVSISGTLTQFGSGNSYANADKLIKVTSFGDLGLTSLTGAFFGTTNLIEVPSLIPVTVYDLSYAFHLTGNSYITGLSNWNVDNITEMVSVFGFASNFNQDLSSWDVSSVVNMGEMFIGASSFNQPLNTWDVSNVTHMHSMFRWANSFDQSLSSWNISNVRFMSAMFSGATLSTSNYNSMLIAWSALDLFDGVSFSGGNSKYSPGAAAAARAAIIADDNWTITDGGMESSIVWEGSSDNEWGLSSCWEGGIVPTITDNVVIPVSPNNPVIIPGSTGSCNNLTIDNGASLTLHSDGVNGTASLLTNGTIQNNGTINVERHISSNKWHLISSPVSNATANTFFGEYLQYYDGSWNDITDATTVLTPVLGYSLWDATRASTYTFTGDLNNGDQAINIISANGGWNLLGNPYPSSIDWAMLDDTYGAVYYWDSENSNYVSWNNGNGTGAQYVPAMQGFWINTASDGTFNVTNAARTHNGNSVYYKNYKTPSNYLELQVDGNNHFDKLCININDKASNNFDFQYDAYKMMSPGETVPQLYSYAGEDMLSIDVRPETEVIQLGFKCGASGNYNIGINKITDINSCVLEDTKTETMFDLKQGDYSFKYSTFDNDKRFKLHLGILGLNEMNKENLKIYTYNKTIYLRSEQKIDGIIKVINVKGQIIIKKRLIADGFTKLDTSLKKGVYFITYEDGSLVKSVKVFIN